MPDLFAQLRLASRRLLRSPNFTLLCVLTLALGIGAVVTIFSIVNGVLLNPLHFPASQELVGLWHRAPGLNLNQMPQSVGTYLLYRDNQRTFQRIALYRQGTASLTGDEEPERLSSVETTASLFDVLRVSPRLGRVFRPEEEGPGAEPVVVLSDRIWQRRFGADPGILGRALKIEGRARTVIGVMPPGFDFPKAETDVWLPMKIDPANAPLGAFAYSGVGRLAKGMSISEAEADLNRLLRNLPQAFPADDAAPVLAQGGFAARVHSLRDDVVGGVGNVLWILLGAVGFILMIACANVANLLIVRGDGRRREMAIYTALGASRGYLMGAVLAESVLLSLIAGAVGLLLALGSVRLLVQTKPISLPRLEEVSIDLRVVVFTAAMSLLTGILFGLIPALRSSVSRELAAELKGGGRAVTLGRGRRHVRQVLVGVQVALALVLLAGSGLMMRSFLRVANVSPGFDPSNALTLQVVLPETEYPDDESAARFFQELVARLSSLPGVESAAVTSSLPLGGSANAGGYEIEGLALQTGAPPPILGFEHVSDSYFRTMKIPLLKGRSLERADQERRTGAVVINERLARRYWKGVDPLGKRLRPQTGNPNDSWYTVVGVVGDIRNRRLTEEADEMVYYPLMGRSPGAFTVRQASVVVRTRVEPETLAGPIRTQIASLASDLPISNVRTLEEWLDQDKSRMAFSAFMFILATVIALILGAVGIYGFVSYLVSQRTSEIGIRIALGARVSQIRWMVLRESLVIAVLGTVTGLIGAMLLTRWLGALLYEVSPLDPLTFALVPILLLMIVLLSSFVPADRAAHVDPLRALQAYE